MPMSKPRQDWNWKPLGNRPPNGASVANYTHLFKNRTSFPVAAGTPRPEDWLANRFGSIIVNYQRGKWNFNLNGTLRAEAKVLPQGTTAGLV